MGHANPVLWHLVVSHYSEKARWALDYKDVRYETRAPLPGSHMAVALWLSRGRQVTLPALELDGRRVCDSTRIIAALEDRYPDPPLYPADPEQRRRALELEEFFDEQLGPYSRRLVFHELGKDPKLFGEVGARVLPGPLRRAPGLVSAYARGFTALRFGARDREGAEEARRKVVAALDRIEAELGDGDHLVGDTFGVADLTAAALFYPIATPPEGPLPGTPVPAALERFREPLRERRGYRYVEQMFRRHRRRHSGAGAAAPAAG